MEGVKNQLYNDLARMKFDPKIWNRNERNESVVLGVLAAGLYPNIARIGGDLESLIKKPKGCLLTTWDGYRKQRVFVHPSSVNYKVKVILSFLFFPSFDSLSHLPLQSFPSPWMVFQEKVQMQQKENPMAKQQVGFGWKKKRGEKEKEGGREFSFSNFYFFSFAFVIHLWSQVQRWLFSVERKCLPFLSLNNLIKQGFVQIALDLFHFLLRFFFILFFVMFFF